MKRILLIFLFSSFVISFTKAQELPSYVPTDGLLAYYPFNGNANDASGNGNNGTVNGATLTTDKDGNENKAYSFDGDDDYITTEKEVNDVKENFTFSVWVNPQINEYLDWVEGDINGGSLLENYKQTVIHPKHGQNYGNESNSAGAGLFVGTNGLVIVEHSDNYLRNALIVTKNLSNWNLITVVYKSNTPEVYINGSLIKSFPAGNRTIFASLGTDSTNRSDYSKSGFGSGFYPSKNKIFTGKIDDIGIWNRALTEEEIQNLYNSSSTNGGDILFNGTVSAENNQIKNVADPTEDQDVVTKSYLETEVNSITQQNIQEVLTNGNNANGTQLKGLADPTDNQDAVTLSLLLSKIEGLQDQIDALQAQSNSGILIDQDGNSYPYLTYKDQVWTVKNAEIETYRDGTPIPQVTDNTEWSNLTTGAWCYYNNDPSKGKLYNWYAVAGIHDNDENTPNKEFAPEGWHVPSNENWSGLIDYLIGNGFNFDGSTTGNKIAKAIAAKSGWAVSDIEGVPGFNQITNNSSAFNILPLGTVSADGVSINAASNSVLWSSTEDGSQNPWRMFVHWGTKSFSLAQGGALKNDGFSVRFVRD